MRKLIFATQKLDPDDPVLAATVPMVRALAARVDELVVLCDSAVPAAVPANARVREFGARTQAERGARFTAALARELRPRPIGVVAHMVPLYAVLAAPLVRPLRIPLVLWYTHWKSHAVVRAAEKVSHGDRVRRRALVSARARGRCTRSGTGSTSTSSRAPTLPAASSFARSCSGATRRRKGWRRSCAAPRSRASTSRLHGSDESFEQYKRGLAPIAGARRARRARSRAPRSRRSSRAATC